jgi:hypothetical protein
MTGAGYAPVISGAWQFACPEDHDERTLRWRYVRFGWRIQPMQRIGQSVLLVSRS